MNNLFLSYARNDDDTFVHRLYNRLRADGSLIWFDRKSMPSRSLTFMHEIRTAIEAADRVLAVIGPAALASDYVRAEWQHAQSVDKIVVPLLRMGELTELPAEFRNLQVVDFRSEQHWRRALAQLRRVLRDPIPVLGTVHGDAPGLPPHFQPRPDRLSEIAGAVLIDLQTPVTITGPAAIVVLHGMGGIGKSVLAAAFARSSAARRSFPDGVFWINVGESADASRVARRLSRILPTTAGRDTIGGSSSAIRAQLAGKRALIVLDNVERVEQLEMVSDVADVNTRILVTARNADVAVASGGRGLTELIELSMPAAAQLLADWLDTAVENLPAEATDLARECGYHPLALALNGAMLRKGNSWGALIEALRDKRLAFAETHIAHYAYPTVQATLEVSLDALRRFDREAASRFQKLAALNWPRGVPEAAITRLWQHCGHVPAPEAMKLVSELAQRALLRTEGQAPNRTVRIHDLQIDYLQQPPADLECLNRDVLAAYRDACDGDWSTGPADGYFHHNLVFHLLVSDLRDDVHQLLGEEREGQNAWYQATSDLGLVDRWIDDVDTALALLTERGIPERSRRVGLQVRYTLMKASVQSQATAVPPTLLDLCVQHGTVPFGKALSFARAASLDEDRVDVLSRLAPHDDALRPVLETEALDTALSIQDPSRQIWAFRRLIPVLSAATASRAYAFVKSVSDNNYSSALLPNLAAVVPLEEIEGIAALARHQGDERLTAETLARLIPRVEDPSALLEEASQLAAGVTDRWREGRHRVMALCAVARVADPTRRAALMDTALSSIEKMDGSNDVAESIAAAAPLLAPAQLERAVTLTEMILTDSNNVQANFALAPHLPRARREQVVTALYERHAPKAGAIPWGRQYAAILATDLPTTQRARIVPKVLPLIIRMAALPAGLLIGTPRPMRQPDWKYEAALEILGSRLPARYVGAAVDLVQRVTDPQDRAEMLGRLVPRLPMADVGPVLSAEYRRVLGIFDTASMARAFAALSAFAPEGERSEIAEKSLELMAQSKMTEYPERVVAAAVGQLPPARGLDVLTDEFDRIAAIGDSRSRDEALATLVPCLTPAQLPNAVNLARTTVPDHYYAALAKLVGRLENDDREAAVDEILAAASGWVAVELPSDFGRALGDIALWMSRRQVDVAFTIVQGVADLTRRVAVGPEYVEMLHHLSRRLSSVQLREARGTAGQIGDPSVQLAALAALVYGGGLPPRSQQARLRQILRLGYSIANNGEKARALIDAASVAGPRRPEVLEDALAAANSVVEDDERATILCEMLTILPPERALEAFGRMLKASLGRRRSGSYGGNPFYAGLGRPFLLSMLKQSAPFFGNLDDPALVSHIAQSLRDVARWWP